MDLFIRMTTFEFNARYNNVVTLRQLGLEARPCSTSVSGFPRILHGDTTVHVAVAGGHLRSTKISGRRYSKRPYNGDQNSPSYTLDVDMEF
jgi:hypothetical protein